MNEINYLIEVADKISRQTRDCEALLIDDELMRDAYMHAYGNIVYLRGLLDSITMTVENMAETSTIREALDEIIDYWDGQYEELRQRMLEIRMIEVKDKWTSQDAQDAKSGTTSHR